jgi:hypothetical protein
MECTFSPKINSPPSGLIKTEEEFDVGTRLFKYQEKYRSNLENKKEKLKEYHTYKPKLSKNTDKILQEREKLLIEMKQKYELEKNNQELNRLEKPSLLDHIDEIEETINENESLYKKTNSPIKINPYIYPYNYPLPNNSSGFISDNKVKKSQQSSINNFENDNNIK